MGEVEGRDALELGEVAALGAGEGVLALLVLVDGLLQLEGGGLKLGDATLQAQELEVGLVLGLLRGQELGVAKIDLF